MALVKKSLLLLTILSSLSLSANSQPKAAYKGLFTGVNIDTQMAVGIGSVLAVAAAILIYKSDNSH